MKRIFICSPFRGSKRLLYERYARELCKYVLDEGHAPFAPHLLYPQMLDDENKVERSLGIRAGLLFMQTCQELWFGSAWGISEGMKFEIAQAANFLGIPIFELKKDEQGRFYRV